jgi:hypothetical protein
MATLQGALFAKLVTTDIWSGMDCTQELLVSLQLAHALSVSSQWMFSALAALRSSPGLVWIAVCAQAISATGSSASASRLSGCRQSCGVQTSVHPCAAFARPMSSGAATAAVSVPARLQCTGLSTLSLWIATLWEHFQTIHVCSCLACIVLWGADLKRISVDCHSLRAFQRCAAHVS